MSRQPAVRSATIGGMQSVDDLKDDSRGAAAQATLQTAARRLEDQLALILRGKPQVIRLVLTALFSGGHLLLEDVPGVGKTTLARALAGSLGLDFGRIQCTADLMPADLIGVNILDRTTGTFALRTGPIFTELLLVDEINRASPKTQSALLEAMAERQVTLDGEHHRLPECFTVIATQNPVDNHGTFALPESQLDRFLFRASLGYPHKDIERAVLREATRRPSLRTLQPVVDRAQVTAIAGAARQVFVEESVLSYLHALVLASRTAPAVLVGASTRAALAWLEAARVYAWLEGRAFLTPGDVRALAVPVLAHRLRMRASAADVDTGNELTALQETTVLQIIEGVPVPL